MFETKRRSKLAILYNDIAVLENHHAASFFFMTENENQNCDIFSGMSLEDKIQIRKQIL